MLLIGTAACGAKKETPKPEPVTTEETEKAMIIEQTNLEGKWQWVSSSFVTRGMKEPNVSSPETRGYNVVLEFFENEIEIIIDGSPLARVPYRLAGNEVETQMLWVDIPSDDFPFYIASGPVYIRDGELYISGGYNDAGENQTYKRLD